MTSRTEGIPNASDDTTRAEPSNFSVLMEKRNREYASRLRPIADADLSPTLRYAYSQASSESDDRCLLHFGFRCPIPRGSSANEVSAAVATKLIEVNDAVGSPKTLKVALVVTDRPAKTIVVAVYSNGANKSPVHTEERIQKARQELCKAFGDGVEGPMWFWDLRQHGAGAHQYKPFDKAYPNGHPGVLRGSCA